MATHAVSVPARQSLLTRVLAVNFSIVGVVGLVFTLGADQLSTLLGPSSLMIRGMGIVFLCCAAIHAWASARGLISRRYGLAIAVLDADWAVVSILALALGWLPLTSAGWWFVALQADVVVMFAALQFYAAWRMRK
jgi:hypothetical protein